MGHWQPQPQGLRELTILLRDAMSPEGHDQTLVQQKLASFHQIPDYNSYLVYLLVMKEQDPYTRAIAGLTLKNNLRSHFNSMPLSVLEHVKESCIHSLQTPEPDANVRKAIGSVITTIVTHGQVHHWPQVLALLVQQLDSHHTITVQMAWDCLSKICEDAARELDQDMDGVRPLRTMIPKFIQFFYHPNSDLRAQAISATSQFVLLGSQSLMCEMEAYLAGLFATAADPHPKVRVEVCRSFVLLIDARPDKMEPYLPSIIEYMIYSTKDSEDQVVLEACDFWLQFANVQGFGERLLPYLPQIVPLLLSKMAYSESDLIGLEGDEEDCHLQDDEKDIKPKFYRHKTVPLSKKQASKEGGGGGEHEREEDNEDNEDEDDEDNKSEEREDDDFDDDDDEDDDFDDDEFYSEWTLRKCSAAALDRLSTAYPEDLVKVLLPLVHQNLFSTDWKEREAGILALGAVAEGGMESIASHLPGLISFLLQSLNDTKPLVRSITCWAMGRFSSWYVEQCQTPEGRRTFFEPVLYNLLQRLLDKNKRVQEAACSAFATMEEEATVELIPYLEPILIHLTTAFCLYQHKNLLILYDALGTLAESVGNALNQPQCLSLMMPPLIAKWNGLSDQSTNLFPLLECLSSITTALGVGFAPFAEPVFSRCVKLVASYLHETFLATQAHNYDPPDVEFMIVALDLLSGVTQGLGKLVDPLVAASDPPLVSLLAVCIHDPVTEVLQSTYALIGDLAIACFDRLKESLPSLMPEIISKLSTDYESVSVCNNAIWAAGEIVMRWDGIEPYIEPLFQRLVLFLMEPKIPESLKENATITIGRLGLASPSLLSHQPTYFIRPWLDVSLGMRENDEKDTAFCGLCELIKVSPYHVIDVSFKF
ncbi:armadillo-type protein [Spinellus fusiger]|nr:armadillo-type protein [Spinellus fusiger]